MSLNIEGDKHLAAVNSLVEREKPDVVCLQEIFEEDFQIFEQDWEMRGKFIPTVDIDEPGLPQFGKKGVFGLAMLSSLSGCLEADYYFRKRSVELPQYRGSPNAGHRGLVWQRITADLTVATTHFTWSKGGRATQKQRRELKSLLKLTKRIRADVLVGDFNAPRRGGIWEELASEYKDNIPAETNSTIDPNLHYSKEKAKLVVDGLFSGPGVKIENIRLVSGVSDHLAIVARAQKLP